MEESKIFERKEDRFALIQTKREEELTANGDTSATDETSL